jgi:hypothetical protein
MLTFRLILDTLGLRRLRNAQKSPKTALGDRFMGFYATLSDFTDFLPFLHILVDSAIAHKTLGWTNFGLD